AHEASSHQEAERARERAQPAPRAARPQKTVVGAERLRRMLRQPNTLRELVVLKELLDRPIALRQGKWARRRFGAR
ncbi:MAG: hypothetical protein H0V44_09795, partial [Planctomycetes bacterium]|nr:hypothetical protein [Planctomycetota bacterium]